MGYLGDPAGTAEHFRPDGARSGARLFRTGDRAVLHPGDGFHLLGRTDQQVKIRGQRVELAEVEAVLRAAPGVRDGAVIRREDGDGGRLEGFVQLAGSAGSGGSPDRVGRQVAAVAAYLAGQLPAAWLPRPLHLVQALPRTDGGKIDRQRLAGLAPDAVAGRGGPPAGEAELSLLSLISQMLPQPGIGRADNLFELGLNSITAARLMDLLNAGLGADLRLADLFAAPSIAGLAALLGGPGSSTRPGRARGPDDHLPHRRSWRSVPAVRADARPAGLPGGPRAQSGAGQRGDAFLHRG